VFGAFSYIADFNNLFDSPSGFRKDNALLILFFDSASRDLEIERRARDVGVRTTHGLMPGRQKFEPPSSKV
jgi:hypothetical protein